MGDFRFERLYDLRVTLRILVVTDGTVGFWDERRDDQVDAGFTMRGMLRAMWDAPTSHGPYVRYRIDHATRIAGASVTVERTESDGGRLRHWTEYRPFRFDDAGFDLNRYDQLWFFGFQPGNAAFGQQPMPGTGPLTDPEVERIAEWMDRGGGVFATGDHAELGSWLCSALPRVRRMRKWTDADGVPPTTTSGRIDTTVPQHTVNGHPFAEFDDQSDNVPKRLRLRRFALWDGLRISVAESFAPVGMRWAPHPILCGPGGPIDILPDHMHEGVVTSSSELVLDGSYVVGGATREEFPHSAKSRPEEIAWARSGGTTTTYEQHAPGASITVRLQEVPTIAVYDGEPVGVGRIVVDGTWHNWLDINLLGVGASTGHTGLLGSNLERVGHYYRNIAQWLATASSREAIRNGLFVHIIANTGGWAESIGNSHLMREMARDVLGRWSSECTRRGWIFEPWWWTIALQPSEKISALLLPPEDELQERLLGAMATAVYRHIPDLEPENHRGDEEDDPDRGEVDADRERVLEQHRRLGTTMAAARTEELRAVVADLRRSLEATHSFVKRLESSLDAAD